MEPTSLPRPRRLHGRHVGYYTGGGKCASCQALAVELGWLDTVHSGPETDGLRGDDAPDAVPTADKMPDATGGTMSSRTGRCYLAASLTGNARSARRPRCGSAKAATRTSAPQACLPGEGRSLLVGEAVGEDAVQTEVVRIIASSLECVVSPTPTPHPTPVELDCTSASIREKNIATPTDTRIYPP